MLAAERRHLILEKLHIEKRVIVSELSGLFAVSNETIRRDLEKLCRSGLAIKSYGGAIINEKEMDLPFNIRKLHKPAEKQKIAGLIQCLVQDGDSVFLDASTTAVFVAKMLKKLSKLTVITNSIEIMIELADKPDWSVIALGGHLKADYLAFSGQRTISGISSFYADKLIFSCKGLDFSRGIFESNEDFSQIKRAMLDAAKVKILAADLSKFGETAFSKIADISDLDVVVTNDCPGEDWLECFKKQDVKCIYKKTEK